MISRNVVEQIAELARLDFSPEEKEQFLEQFARIVEYVEAIKKLEGLEQYEPLVNVLGIENVFRDDQVQPSLPPEEALRNAPSRKELFFRVPKVIE